MLLFLQLLPIDILVDIWMADEKYPIFFQKNTTTAYVEVIQRR